MSEFLTMSEYLDAAERMLRKFNNCVGINDEDAISFVATHMMKADQRYDQSKCGENGNRYGYRAACGKYAILRLRKMNKKSKNKLISFESLVEKDNRNAGFPIDTSLSVVDMVQFNEIIEIAKEILSEKQFCCFKQYFVDGDTIAKIGKKLGITRQAVSLNIIKSKKKIKEYMGIT